MHCFCPRGLVRGCWRGVALVHRDVEAGLLEFFFHVDFASLLKVEQSLAHPTEFLTAEIVFGDIDGSPGHMRADDVTLGRCGIAVGGDEPLLVLDCTHCRAYLQGAVKGSYVGAREVGQETRRPGAAVAAVSTPAAGWGSQTSAGCSIVEVEE